MLRRALFWLLPVLLVLAFAHPVPRAADAYGTAIERSVDVSAASLVSTAFLPNDRAAGSNPWTELDDDDRVVQAGAVTAWAPVAISVPLCRASDVVRSAYPTSAAYPRGPPASV